VRLATANDFFHGAIYTNYRHHEGFAKRARLFKFFPEPILVVGCGFGFLVQEFENLGKLAWGIDASPYAINHKVNMRVIYGDVLRIHEWKMGEFATLITEDLLPHLTNDEALIAARNCQALSPVVIHMVTEQGQADLNYRPCAEWMSVTSQLTVSLEGM
jgi:SAM-dependent methyltransferase